MRLLDHGLGANMPTLSVWLVDDDEATRELLPQFLNEQLDIRVTRTFAQPIHALAAAQEGNAADVVLMDVHFRGESGLDYIRPLRQHAPKTRVVMFATFMNIEDEAEALSEGAAAYLLKSARAERIARRIHESKVPQHTRGCGLPEVDFARPAPGKKARLEPAVRGFRRPTGSRFLGMWTGLARLWKGATAHAARLGLHF